LGEGLAHLRAGKPKTLIGSNQTLEIKPLQEPYASPKTPILVSDLSKAPHIQGVGWLEK
jgi:hypothetical protein